MKKGFFIVLFLLTSFFAFSKELTEFDDIDFGTHENKVIALMESKGYKASFPAPNVVSFTKPNETYLECNVKEYVFVFSSVDNNLISYAIILDRKNRTIYKDAPTYFKTKYNAEIDDTIISNPAIDIFKIPFSDNSCILLIDTKLTEYIIRFCKYDVWLD